MIFKVNLILHLFILVYIRFLYWLRIVLWMHTFLMGFFPSLRRFLFWLKLGALQYAILKTVLSVLSIVLWTNGNFDLSDVSLWNASCLIVLTIKRKWQWNLKHFFLLLFQLEITGTAIWINPFIGVLTITSLWPVAIIFMNTNSFMRSLNIVPKYAMYQVSQHNNFCIYPAFHYNSKPLKTPQKTLSIK